MQIRNLCMTVLALAALVVGMLLWGGRALSLDPTRRVLDEIAVPAWAAQGAEDDTYGSRWCLEECRVRVRTWQSEGKMDETAVEYWQSLLRNGWIPVEKERCPGGVGVEGCFTKDELFLEIWVAPIECEDRFTLCVGSTVTMIVASQAAWPRLFKEAAL